MTVLQFGRTVICDGCGKPHFEQLLADLHCCAACEEMAANAMIADADGQARAAGFATFDEWASAGYPEVPSRAAP